MSAGWGSRASPLLFLVLPLVLVGRALGPHKAPGMATEMLMSQLYAGAQVRRWWEAGTWLLADVAGGRPAWWPDNLVASAGIALGGEDPGLACGVVLLLALVACGLGPWWLARALGAGALGALVAGLLVQASPPVLRAAWSGEHGVLGVGPAAMAAAALLAGGRGRAGLLALLAGSWTVAAAVPLLVVGAWKRRPEALLVLAPLLVALASAPSAVPGAARLERPHPRTVAAYVGEGLAVLPLPPAEQVPDLPAGEAGGGGIVQAARLPGGLGLWVALLGGLALRGRGWAALGTLALVGFVAAFGLLPARGSPPAIPAAWVVDLGPWVPGLRAPVGTAAWLLPALVGAGAAVARWPRWALGLLAVPAGLAAWLENPRLSVPVTNTSPDPVAAVLEGLPEGGLVVFPSATWPWRQSRRPTAALLFDATRHGHPVEAGARFPADAALVGTLSQVAGVSVDQAAARALWELRYLDPLAAVREAGFSAILVDRGQLAPDQAGRVDAWLASRVGLPILQAGDRAVYLTRAVAAP